jgi:hypothetical protein
MRIIRPTVAQHYTVIILYDNYRLPHPVGSLIILTQPTDPMAHARGGKWQRNLSGKTRNQHLYHTLDEPPGYIKCANTQRSAFCPGCPWMFCTTFTVNSSLLNEYQVAVFLTSTVFWNTCPWIWRQYDPPERRQLFARRNIPDHSNRRQQSCGNLTHRKASVFYAIGTIFVLRRVAVMELVRCTVQQHYTPSEYLTLYRTANLLGSAVFQRVLNTVTAGNRYRAKHLLQQLTHAQGHFSCSFELREATTRLAWLNK